jgi:hypothetical protein
MELPLLKQEHDEPLLLGTATYPPKETPVPRLQIALIGAARASQPLLFFSIFPWINPALVAMRIADEAHVGAYSSALEGAAAVFNVLALLPWAYLGDSIGRKPVILMGVSAACTASVLFGLGGTYAWLFVLRGMLGLASAAQGAISRVVAAELSDQTNLARCMIYSGMFFQAGAVAAPVSDTVGRSGRADPECRPSAAPSPAQQIPGRLSKAPCSKPIHTSCRNCWWSLSLPWLS